MSDPDHVIAAASEPPHKRKGEPPPAPEPLPVDVFDSHCHLDAMGCQNDKDIAEVVQAAQAVGVRHIVTTADTVESSRWCAAAAERHPDIVAAIAVHPNETGDLDEAAYDELTRLAQLPRVRAIGETGLDYYRNCVDPATQQEAFRRHIQLAKDVNKPLVIHDRDAHEDVLKILLAEGIPQWTVLHCFSGDADVARAFLDNGCILSFSGTVTFKSAAYLREAARIVPLGQLIVETDAPFLSPTPYRGRPNSPYLIPFTVRAVASVKDMDISDLCSAIAAAGERVFGPW